MKKKLLLKIIKKLLIKKKTLIKKMGKLQIALLKFGLFGFYTLKFQNLNFTP